MAQKPESRLQRRIRKALEKEFPQSFWIKIWSGPFQVAGFPDLLGCVQGRFIALEVKMPGEEPSAIQRYMMKLIKRAGGITSRVESVEEAINVVRRAL